MEGRCVTGSAGHVLGGRRNGMTFPFARITYCGRPLSEFDERTQETVPQEVALHRRYVNLPSVTKNETRCAYCALKVTADQVRCSGCGAPC